MTDKQNLITEVKEALGKAGNYDFFSDFSQHFPNDPSAHIITNALSWLQQLVTELEEAHKEIERLKQIEERECKFTLNLRSEIEYLRMQRESLEAQLQHYRGYQ